MENTTPAAAAAPAERARPYPLLLEPVIVDRIWGGTRLGPLLRKTPPGAGSRRIGETWESANESRVINGTHAGQTLGDLARRLGPALIGNRSHTTSETPFPLLAKFIEAEDVLSVQVHPDDDYARERLGQPYGKTEAWYVIEAKPDAVIYHGVRADADAATVGRSLAGGAIRDLLATAPARAGDTLFTPAGTIHAIGAGIILYEIQQYSDVTFRLYDWDRLDDSGKPRETHLEQGRAVLDTTPPTHHHSAPLALDERGERTILTACRYFALELLQPRGPLPAALDGGTFHLLAVLSGAVTIACPGADPVEAGVGQSVLIPALVADYLLTPTGDCRLLRSTVPDLHADVIAPLRSRGIRDEQIAQLGGGWPDRNDLLPLLRQ